MSGLIEFVRQNPKLSAYVATITPFVVLALLKPDIGWQWFRGLESKLARIGQHQRASIVLLFLAGLFGATIAGTIAGVPVPRGHDELSHALAGDTFASGRLTNPPHPMWMHFETFEVIVQPTYMSKYPPGNALLLAAGQVLSGNQALGLWLGAGMLSATVLWALQAWFSPGWALFGGIIAALQFGIYSYWTQTYYGGALTCAGGALVFGGMRRIMNEARARDAVLLAVGLVILANTRPFEGLGISIPVAVALLVWFIRQRVFSARTIILRVVVPVVTILAAAGCWMAYYNYRITGKPFRVPYQVYTAAYETISPIGGAVSTDRVYRNSAMQAYYGGWVEAHARRSSGLEQLYNQVKFRGQMLWGFYIGPVFTIPVLVSLAMVRRKWIAFAWAMTVYFALFLGISTWIAQHYAAPGTVLVMIVVVAGMQRLCTLKWRGKPTGLFLVRAIPAVLVLILVCRIAQPRLFPRVQWIHHRMRIQETLEQTNERHLIFVRYTPKHSTSREWISNRADIDGAKVVWAIDLGPEQNWKLLTYMRDRKAWHLEADTRNPQLQPYSAESLAALDR